MRAEHESMTGHPATASAHLLAGFDGSAPATRAVRWAAAEAVRRGVALDVLACYFPPPMVGLWAVPYDLDGIRDGLGVEMARVVGIVHDEFPGLHVDGRVVLGRPGEELAKESKAADMVVLGTSGAGAVESMLLGSVAHAVARNGDCPVVLVPDVHLPRNAHGVVVVGIDGSASANAALDWAVAEADRRDAELAVVHAWRDTYGTVIDDEEAHDLRRVDAALELDIAVERARTIARGAVRGVLVEGRAADAILESGLHADLVVVGSRGRGALRSTLFGSVAHAVAERAKRPVAIIRAAEETA
jgi:nucleotide-binding universal stress UspA family protein